MPAQIEQYMSDGSHGIIGYVYPGYIGHLHSHGPDGKLNRLLMILCPDSDINLEVFESPNPELISDIDDEEVLEAAIDDICVEEHHKLTINANGQEPFELDDVDDGHIVLIVKHIGEMSLN